MLHSIIGKLLLSFRLQNLHTWLHSIAEFLRKIVVALRALFTTAFFGFVFALTLSGCASTTEPIQEIIEGRKVEYERDEYQARKDLQYPPDIVTSATAEYEGSQLLSEYSIASVPEIGTNEDVALGGERKVSYRREGNLRWIEVDLSATDTWLLAKKFWDDLGYAPDKEQPELGRMETAWLNIRTAPLTPGLGGLLDGVISRVQDSGERDKFISSVEVQDDEKSVLYISHRHTAAEFSSQGLFSGFKPLPADPQLEAEMLRRFMIFAARTPEAQQEDAFVEEIADEEEAGEQNYQLETDRLIINKPLDESWLLVRIGLDRGGFTIDDQDNSNRIYYIQHTGGPESQQIFGKVEKGFFNKLFAEEQPILREIKLTVTAETEESAVVRVTAADDEDALTESQVEVLLELLSVNLP